MPDTTAIQAAPTVTTDQLDLIKRTVANGATADELKLYLYDCQRQGVHPLDKLIHFTKRQGKYTPITSIDFMRTRAADTGEYAGSDDAKFLGGISPSTLPLEASVTVWRLVQGQRCSFTATARWDEYCPEPGPSGKGDIMWRKMPHTMLAKCAEALALRKGFPRQLAGLYAKEEMEQAGPSDNGYTVTAPDAPAAPPSAIPPTRESRETVAAPTPGDSGAPSDRWPAGATKLGRFERKASGKVKGYAVDAHMHEYGVYDEQLASLCEQVVQDGDFVMLQLKRPQSGGKPYLIGLRRIVPSTPAVNSETGEELSSEEIPF